MAYLTVKGKYLNDVEPGWRLVAVLQVLHRLDSHAEGAEWYRDRDLPLPSNCLVPGNAPKGLGVTGKSIRTTRAPKCGTHASKEATAIEWWDQLYQERVADCPTFLVCVPRWLNLLSPPQLLAPQLEAVFGSIPGTQGGKKIVADELSRLVGLCGITLVESPSQCISGETP